MKQTTYFLLICIAGILFSCKEDEGILKHEPNEKAHHGYKRSMVTFQDMTAKLSAAKSIALFGNMANKGEDDYIRAIDSTYIIQFSNDTLTTYTLRVSTLDDENYSYSNLIIRLIDGETEEFVAHYTPTPEWQAAHMNGEVLPYEGTLELTDTTGVKIGENADNGTESKVSATCGFGLEPVWTDCHGASCPCTDGGGYQSGYNIILVPCIQNEGGGGNDGNDGDHGGGGGSGGGSGGGNNGLPTDPMGYMGLVSDYFYLTSDEQYYLYSHHKERVMLNNFLEDNHSIDDQEFIDELLDKLVLYNYSIPTYYSSNYPGKSDGMPFKWWESENYLNNYFNLDFYDDVHLTKQEKILIAIWAEQAYIIYKNKPIAENMTISVFGYNGRNDKSDAFRHSFFNAINTRDVQGGLLIRGRDIVRLFGRAHESEVPDNLIKEKIMDLHNNDIGINAYGFYTGMETNNEIKDGLYFLLNQGHMTYLSPLTPPLGAPNYGITSSTQVIPTNE